MESMSEKIKSLRAIRGMNRREFSENFGIPMRTLEDWEYGKRIPPEYVVRLLAYKVKMENFQESGNTKNEILKSKECEKRSVSIISNMDGNKVVVIHDIIFIMQE